MGYGRWSALVWDHGHLHIDTRRLDCSMSCLRYLNNIELIDSKNIASDIKVISDKDLCKSDHYLITLEIKTNVKHKKVPKTA